MAITDTRHIVLEPPAGSAPGAGLWIAALADGRRRTLETLERVEPEMVDGDVPGQQHTLGTLLYHIALIEADWLFVEIQERDTYPEEAAALFPWSDRDEQGRLISVTGLSLEAHLERLNRVRALLVETLMGLSDDDFSRAREIPGVVVSTAWVIHHLLQHEAEHRGELGQILDTLRQNAPA